MPPRYVGPYEVLSVAGRGGVGTVYRARHRETGLPIALKLLGPPPACDAGAARRLAREFEALRGLEHPNVVRVYDAGVYEGYSYLAMELVEGLDLRSYLSPALDDGTPPAELRDASLASSSFAAWSDEPQTASLAASSDEEEHAAGADAIRAFAELMEEPETDPGAAPAPGAGSAGPPRATSPEARSPAPVVLARLAGPRRLARLLDAMEQVCAGLAYVHARGLVHRDLKPSNIMVDDQRRVRLMDFGLVKLSSDSASITHHGKVVGTYRYMAPEQARGEPVDARSDLYSLGVILFELLCGRPPFTARRAVELWNDIVSRPAPAVLSVNPAADPRLAAIAARLLAKDPRERFQTADDVARHLRAPA